jgi:hypothetical protein
MVKMGPSQASVSAENILKNGGYYPLKSSFWALKPISSLGRVFPSGKPKAAPQEKRDGEIEQDLKPGGLDRLVKSGFS